MLWLYARHHSKHCQYKFTTLTPTTILGGRYSFILQRENKEVTQLMNGRAGIWTWRAGSRKLRSRVGPWQWEWKRRGGSSRTWSLIGVKGWGRQWGPRSHPGFRLGCIICSSLTPILPYILSPKCSYNQCPQAWPLPSGPLNLKGCQCCSLCNGLISRLIWVTGFLSLLSPF